MDVFSYLKSCDSFSDLSKLIGDAEKYRVSDPQASILKVASVLEIVVNRVLENENIYVPNSELNIKINKLRGIILDRAVNDMHSIRSIRNSSAAHVSYSTNSIQADKIESLFCLKKIYEVLQWYLNYNTKKTTSFCTFEDYLDLFDVESSILSKVTNIDIVDEKPKITMLPKFYIDFEFQAKYRGKSIEDIDEKDIRAVFSLFFETKYDLKTIEKIVFKNDKPNGDIVYAIITLYKMIGLTNSWRRFVQQFGLHDTIEKISKEFTEEKDIEIKHKLSILEQILKNITSAPTTLRTIV